MIDDIIISPLKIIPVNGGDVLHAMKAGDNGYAGFGEAYFSIIEFGIIKAWKRHKHMYLNFIVPLGSIRFILFDDRNKNKTNRFQEVILSRDDYSRLSIPPMVWVGFQGLVKESSLLLNIANIEHSPSEVEKKNIEDIKYDWGI